MAARAVPDRSAADARVCVIIPCYNDGAFVAQAVASIREAEPVETVVVDDGSTDTTTRDALARLEESGVTVSRHDANQGVSATRATALGATSAPLVFSLDADDLLVAGALGAMADRLEPEADTAVCYGDYIELSPDRLLLRAVPEELDPYRLAFTNEFPAAALFRRTALEAAGGWRSLGIGLDARSDWSLWLALAEQGAKGVHLGAGRATYVHRLHGGRLTVQVRGREREIHRALRDRHPAVFGSLDAHRQSSPLASHRKPLYPILYSIRHPAVRRRAKAALDRLGVWTLQRHLSDVERDELLRGVREAEVEGTRLTGSAPATSSERISAQAPVIVIGCGRSGTTYVSRVLEGLGVFMGARQDENSEAYHFIRLNTAVLAKATVTWSDPEPLRAKLEDPRFRARVRSYADSRLRAPFGAGYLGRRRMRRWGSILRVAEAWGWKDPRNTFTLPVWLDLFPDAKVIHVVRHGADVAGSLWQQQDRPRPAAFLASAARKRRFHLPTIAREGSLWFRAGENRFPFPRVSRFQSPDDGIALWDVYTTEAERHVERLGERACELRFEDLLAEPESHIRSLAEFCGVPASAEIVAELAADADARRAFAYRRDPELSSMAERSEDLLVKHGYASQETPLAPDGPASGG